MFKWQCGESVPLPSLRSAEHKAVLNNRQSNTSYKKLTLLAALTTLLITPDSIGVRALPLAPAQALMPAELELTQTDAETESLN